MNDYIAGCSDVNSPYCPCLLAETNHCVFCSKLRGRAECDCDWAGVCVLYERHWRKLSQDPPAARVTEQAHVLRRDRIGERTHLFTLAVSAELARQLDALGSFVFLRRLSDVAEAHFPVGVMAVRGNAIDVAVEGVGVKSSRFIDGADEPVVVRGPYSNSLLGKPWVENLTGGNVVVVAGGIGQAPAIPIIRRLAAGGNNICLIAAPGKVGAIFAAAELADESAVTIYPVRSLRRDGFVKLRELLLNSCDLLVSAGPDAQHSGLIRFMSDLTIDIPMAATNNATMCCGEGICGSCIKTLADGRQVKLCKMQLTYERLMVD